MDDLISRQAAIEEITDANIVENMDSVIDTELHRVKRAVHRIIANMPSAQPDIVRCGECKWWADVDGATKKIGLGACCCGNKVMRLGFLTTKGWFCADGERKDDETD